MYIDAPKIELHKLFGGLSLFVGLLLFLVDLHLMAIQQKGNISAVLSTTFQVALTVLEVMLVLGIVFVIIQMLIWLYWTVTTPAWKKKRIINNQKNA